MTPLVWIPLLAVAALGHFAFALFLFNRLHSQAWPYRLRQGLERMLFLVTLAVPTLFALIWTKAWPMDEMLREAAESLGWIYLGFCVLAALLVGPLWFWPKWRYRVPDELLTNETSIVDLRSLARPTVQGSFPRCCAALPGNEVFQLHVQTKTLQVTNLPEALHGLRIAHLTDLHLTGKIGQVFFAEAIKLTNELKPDLIAMTGDIAERTPCLPWIQPLFGALQAPLGKYYVLGNHDFLLPDANVLRSELTAAGFVELRGVTRHIKSRGAEILLAGNELPWCGPEPEVPPRDDAFRLLLAHTPDLYSWAQQQDFDLMLAGHNHGGQIRIPFIGPIVSPSRFGTRYAAGLFREGPTLLHVGRGLSGEHLLRWNCPPELTLLVLERG